MKIKSKKSGQVLVETCMTLLFELGLFVTMLLAMFHAAAMVLLHVEAYSLARTSLYGATRPCSSSEMWPPFQRLQLRFECHGTGKVSAKFQLGTRVMYRTEVSLLR